MRDFFIGLLEMVVHVVVVLMLLGVLVMSVMMFMTDGTVEGMSPQILALLMLVGGTLGVIIMAGSLYLGLGVYRNTKRLAELLHAQG